MECMVACRLVWRCMARGGEVAWQAVLRVRCSSGLGVSEYQGSLSRRAPTDVDLPGVDCDKALMVALRHGPMPVAP